MRTLLLLTAAALLLAAVLTTPGTVRTQRRGSVTLVPSPALTLPKLPPRHELEAASRSRAPQPRHGGEFILTATAYTWTGHRTASGQWAAKGIAASDLFPLGTRLHVQGIGEVTIEDRPGCCTQLDIYMTSEQACIEFGRRQVHVTVLLP